MILKLVILHMFLNSATEGGLIQQLMAKRHKKQTDQLKKRWEYHDHYSQQWHQTMLMAPPNAPYPNVQSFSNGWNDYGIMFHCLDGFYNQMYNPLKGNDMATQPPSFPIPTTAEATPSTPVTYSTELRTTDSPTTRPTVLFDLGTTEPPATSTRASDEDSDYQRRFETIPVRSNEKKCEQDRKREEATRRRKSNRRRYHRRRPEPINPRPDYSYESYDEDYDDTLEEENREVIKSSEEDDDYDYSDFEEEIKNVRNRKFPNRKNSPSRRRESQRKRLANRRAQTKTEGIRKTPSYETPRPLRRRVSSKDDLRINKRGNSKINWKNLETRRNR